jgi:hypothetical protein
MGTTIIASILSKIVAVYLLSLIASSEVSAAQGISSNSWNLKSIFIRKNGSTMEDADVNYLEQTCGCSLERHEFSLDIACDGNCKLFSSAFRFQNSIRLYFLQHHWNCPSSCAQKMFN